LTVLIQAQSFTDTPLPVNICGTPTISNIDVQSILEILKKNNFPEYQRLMSMDLKRRSFNEKMVDQREFWALNLENFSDPSFYLISATLRKTGSKVKIWVEDSSWDSSFVTQSEVDAIYEALEISTSPTSLDPNKGIVEIDNLLFGDPPNKDGDGIIDFLILDIKDSFDPDENNFSFIAGYFFPVDQQNKSSNQFSNEMDLLYLDSTPGIFYNENRRTATVLSTTAHELQHLIHYNYDKDEEDWVNEGLSEIAGLYCGYGISFPYLYLKNTNVALTDWSDEVSDYSRVNLWTLYISEQIGHDFIKALTQNLLNGISAYQQLLPSFTSLNFDDIFKDWTVANYVNNPVINNRYGYQNFLAKGYRAADTETIYQFPDSRVTTIENYGTQYFRFRAEDTLEVNFTNLPPAAFFLKNTRTEPEFLPIQTPFFDIYDLSIDDEYILVLGNGNQTNLYTINSYSPYSLQYYKEEAYDDYQSDGSLVVNGAAANKFIVPSAGLKLTKIKFFNSFSNTLARLQIYDQAGGSIGSPLIDPIDTTLAYQDAWVEIELPQPLGGLLGGQSIYAAVEFLSNGSAIGYDRDADGAGLSFVNTGSGWRPISNSDLDGAVMIRVIFEGNLVESGQVLIESPLAYLYPNPSRGILYLNTELNGPGELRVVLFDILGRKVGELQQNFSNAGRYNSIQWDVTNGFNRDLANGVYISRISFKNATTGEKFTLGSQKIFILK
jgi:hypothetical protein